MSTPSATKDKRCNIRLSTWWFASALCPLLAGTLGPIATAFDICSLTAGWRHMAVRHQDGIDIDTLRNPEWFIALDAVSVGSGLISNAIFFLFTWSKLSFYISIVGILIQSSILIGLSISIHALTSSTILGTYHFTQAYYYAITAAAFSTTTLICMFFHGYGTIKNYYPIPLTMDASLANLFRQLITLMVYLLLGAALYAHIEKWSYLDAVFWANFTVLTIGLGGDVVPKTSLGRGLLLPYAIGGIVLIALLVISIRSLLLRGRNRLTAHLIETSRERLEKRLLTLDETSTSTNNENAFNLVRRIPLAAKRRCSLIVYALSTIATLTLLLGGASIFHIVEKEQLWTYGISLYFAYVSLLTIGYGDYIPQSESGKAFFVVWSLLSVPILTIFINNSVDAVYGSIHGLMPYCIRLLPRHPYHRLRFPRPPETAIRPLDRISRYDLVEELGKINAESSSKGSYCLSRLAYPEIGETSRPQGCSSRSSPSVKLLLRCHHLSRQLSAAVKVMMVDPKRKYSYKEWAYYFNLVECTTQQAQNSSGEVQQGNGLRSTCNHLPSLSSALHPPCSINWASADTPILLQNETEWIYLWLSGELTKLSDTLVIQATECSALGPHMDSNINEHRALDSNSY